MEFSTCRRQDNALRESINRMQRVLTKPPDIEYVYQHILKESLYLTDSKFGFIATINEHGAQKNFEVISLDNYSDQCLKAGFINNEIDFLFSILDEQIAKVFSASLLSNVPCDELGWPTLNSLIAIPIIQVDTILAVLCLANSTKPYSNTTSNRILPFLVNAVSMIAEIDNIWAIRSPEHTMEAADEPIDMLRKFELSCPIGVIEINQDHKIVRINPAAQSIFHISQQDALDQEINNFLPERCIDHHELNDFSSTSDIDSDVNKLRFLARCADETIRPVDVVSTTYMMGNETHYLVMVQDNYELERTRLETQSQIQKFRAVSDMAPVGILHAGVNWKCIYVNNRWCEICQLDRAEIIERGWITSIHIEDIKSTIVDLRDVTLPLKIEP